MKFPETENYLKQLGYDIETEVVAYLEKNKKVASGKLVNSVETFIETDKDGIRLMIRYADYGKFVISGRKAGSKAPPVAAIKKWLTIKNPTLKKKDNIKNLDSAAFLIARSIASRGIKPYNFRSVYDDTMKDATILKKIEDLLAKDFLNSFRASDEGESEY